VMQGVRRERCQSIVTDEQRSITPKAPRREAVARRAMTVVQPGPVTLWVPAPPSGGNQTRIGISTYSAGALSFSRISVGAAASFRCTSTTSPSIWPRMSRR